MIKEKSIKGRKFRRLVDKDSENWERICWTVFDSYDGFQNSIKHMSPKHYKGKDI